VTRSSTELERLEDGVEDAAECLRDRIVAVAPELLEQIDQHVRRLLSIESIHCFGSLKLTPPSPVTPSRPTSAAPTIEIGSKSTSRRRAGVKQRMVTSQAMPPDAGSNIKACVRAGRRGRWWCRAFKRRVEVVCDRNRRSRRQERLRQQQHHCERCRQQSERSNINLKAGAPIPSSLPLYEMSRLEYWLRSPPAGSVEPSRDRRARNEHSCSRSPR